jgi:hypothetical protein
LTTLNDEFKDLKFINKEIASVLKTKSLKQISDKRRRLGLCKQPQDDQDVGNNNVLDDRELEQDRECIIDLSTPFHLVRTRRLEQFGDRQDSPQRETTSNITQSLTCSSHGNIDSLIDDSYTQSNPINDSISEPIEDVESWKKTSS